MGIQCINTKRVLRQFKVKCQTNLVTVANCSLAHLHFANNSAAYYNTFNCSRCIQLVTEMYISFSS